MDGFLQDGQGVASLELLLVCVGVLRAFIHIP